MTDTEREKLLDRVRKLMNLAGNNPNEAEAAAAVAKAQAILIEHNLSMAEVKESEKDTDEYAIEPVSETDSLPWRRFIGAAVAELYFCKYFYTTRKRNVLQNGGGKVSTRITDVHSFVGSKSNIAVASMMFTYLHETVNRLAKDGAKANPHLHGSKYRTTFRSSATTRLCQRIRQRINAAKSGTLKSSTGGNLPACLNMYEQAAAKAESTLAAMGKALTTHKTRLANLDAKAYGDGFRAGDSIGLDSQVGTNPKQKRIVIPHTPIQL